MPVGTTLEARRGGAAHHFVGQRGRRDVDLADRLAHQRVAHRAADHARFLAVAVEHASSRGSGAFAQPGGIDDPAARVT